MVGAAAAWGPQLLPQRSPGDTGGSLAALRGQQSPILRGPGTGEGTEPPPSSRQGSVKTNSPVTGQRSLVWCEPSWTFPALVACLGQRHGGVPESPVLQGAPGAPEPAVSWCRAAPAPCGCPGSGWIHAGLGLSLPALGAGRTALPKPCGSQGGCAMWNGGR